MKVTLKEVFESDNWIITAVHQGYKRMHRVDARRRFPKADHSNFFSKWGSYNYLNRLANENYGKKLTDFSTYKY